METLGRVRDSYFIVAGWSAMSAASHKTLAMVPCYRYPCDDRLLAPASHFTALLIICTCCHISLLGTSA